MLENDLDPVQEHLRTHKDKWNAAASELISKIIAFKRGINGRGDSDYQLPVSSIKEPLPPEVGSFLNGLSTEFQSLVSGAAQIIQEQANYSKNRKKKQASANLCYEEIIIVEASNPFTRALAKLTSLFKRDRYKVDRVALLELSSQLYKDLVTMQDLVVSRGLKYEDFFKQDGKIKTGLKKMQDQFKILQQKIKEDQPVAKEPEKTVEDVAEKPALSPGEATSITPMTTPAKATKPAEVLEDEDEVDWTA